VDESRPLFAPTELGSASPEFPLDQGTQGIAGVEVKAGATVRREDFRGLRKLQRATGRRFTAGVVLYDGETSASFGEHLFAVPIRTLWEP